MDYNQNLKEWAKKFTSVRNINTCNAGQAVMQCSPVSSVQFVTMAETAEYAQSNAHSTMVWRGLTEELVE